MTASVVGRKTVLVTGATGSVGPSLVEGLLRHGYSVRCLVRSPQAATVLPPGTETYSGDITDAGAMGRAMAGVDAVMHLAALLHVTSPPLPHEEYRRVNVGGTETVVSAARAAGVRQLVFFSTIAVYGPSQGRVLSETSACHPPSLYARTKLDAELVALRARRQDGEPLSAVLRLAAVYGGRVKGNYHRMVRALSRHRFVPVGPGLNRRTLVYESDVARAAILALEHSRARGQVYNVSDGRFHTTAEIVDAICAALGRRVPRLNVPLAPARLAVRWGERAAALIGVRTPVTSATLETYTEDVAVDGSFIRSDLGFAPMGDIAQGWKVAVSAMRRRGEIV